MEQAIVTPIVSKEDQLRAELEKLRAENAKLTAAKDAQRAKQLARPVTIKVSEKGAVSVYGLGRFPVTLYKEQWLKLLRSEADIKTFLAANDSRLAVKA